MLPVLPSDYYSFPGARSFPSIAATVVLCNDWAPSVYRTDEYGFNNPRGLWSAGKTRDADWRFFRKGYCVPREERLAEFVRR